MQFPHLSDTKFPNISTVNVYQFQNNFDYSRWNEKSTIKLCNVLWNSEYSDVVKFDSDAERDTWFDSLTVYTLQLETAARVVPEGYVKLPIPYDVIAKYNYLFIDMPIATNENNRIDYETNDGIRRWYFFIQNIQYLSPNATQVYVTPDIWTNFQNSVDIPYMLLERGHAPVAASNTDEYLANPISNNKLLLAPDVNFDNASITRSSSYVPFGNGRKFVCLASTCATTQVTSLGTVFADDSYDPSGVITYSDIDARYGYQLQVNGLSFGNGRNYSNARTPAKAGTTNDGRIANNLTVYAIPATTVYGANSTFLTDIVEKCPQFLTTVKACFVVDENCITLSSGTYTIAGYAFQTCVGKQQNLLTKALQKSDFSYPQELQRFAKLYTAPYAQLEITDNNGNTFEVNIEETSTLSVKSVVSVAFPYINERVYVDGIGGVGSSTYSWVDLRGNTSQLQMGNSDWFKYCFDWEIPTFALYMDGETAFMLESLNRNVKRAMQQELVNYHNTMRSANTAYENACDQADVAYTNTENAARIARENAYKSADTGETNAYNTANTAKTNADNTADANHTIAYNNADLSYRTVDRTCTTQSQNLATANTAIAANEETACTAASVITNYTNTLASVNVNFSNAMLYYTTNTDVEKSTATSMNSGIGAIASGALSGAQAGVIMGGTGGASIGAVTLPVVGTVPGVAIGALGGAVVGAAGGGISAAVNNINTGITTNTAQVITDAQSNANTFLNQASMQTADDITDTQNDAKRVVYRTNANSSTTQMDNSNLTSRTNADDARTTAKGNADTTQTTTKTNATNTQTTAKTNATNTKNTSRSNALDTYNATNTNATNTKNNVKANSLYTRQVAELNAKEILENGKYSAMAAILDSRNSAPVECCSYGGDVTPDYMQTRGIQIKVKTQSDSAIRQTGDVFARFGYTLNQVWDVATSGLKLMKHFTYWKAAEIWVNDDNASNNAINTFIRNMFLNGVTVWNNPTEIGCVNVYNN